MSTFFKNRMELYGINDTNNKIVLNNPEAESPAPKNYTREIFTEDKHGNIKITFYHIDRTVVTYYTDAKNPNPREWFQLRLKEPIGDMKYKITKGQGTFPFFPPNLVEAYENQTEIETLFLTEGAFKAFKASQYGVHMVGLTSITHYKNKDGELHSGIQLLIERCNVKNLVILWDGDCLDISQKQLYHKEELTQRPFQFFNAAQSIRKLVYDIDLNDRDKILVYFSHIKSECLDTRPKGIDDLLIDCESHKKHKPEAVAKEITRINSKKNLFFEFRNITASTSSLHKYFRLDDAELFYHRHSQRIANQEFIFDNDVYSWNEGTNKLELIAPAWSNEIVWIGDDYFKIVEEPTAHNDLNKVLRKRSKQTLVDRHGKDFYTKIPYFEGFCNVPSHFEYKNTHGKFYNRYFPFPHEAIEGDCPMSIEFLKHIFGEEIKEHNGKKYPAWQLGLDYVQILICNPTQILPVLILYSQENNTGKSTFGKWLRQILGHNSIQIGNNDFKSQFNDHWTDKLLAICEETLLDRKRDVEQIKAYATSTRITVNPKGYKPYEIDFFTKFQFYSNNKKMIYVTNEDQRFWILEIPVPKKDDPNVLDKLRKEIPHFIHFIKHRELITGKESRMHFHPSLIRTQAFLNTVEVNQPQDSLELREKIKEMFLDFGAKEIMMPLKNINKEFFGNRGGIPWIKQLLQDYLNVDKVRNPKTGKSKQVRGSYFIHTDSYDSDGTRSLRKVKVSFNDRPYIFHRKDFVTEFDEVEDENDSDLNQNSTLELV